MVHNRSLDGLRGVAVLFVMLFHFGYFTAGWIGVQIFFVLSGFLITSILVADRRYPEQFFKRFYWRRSVRIFPLYFGYLAVLSLVFVWTGSPEAFGTRWAHLYSYSYNYALLLVPLTQSPAFTHFWSLAVEEQFYLLWPLAVYYLSQQSLRAVVAAALIAAPLFRLVSVWLVPILAPGHPEPGLFAYAPLPAQFDALATGAALALLPHGSGRRLLPLSGATVVMVVLGLTSGVAASPLEPGASATLWDRIVTAAGGLTGFGYPPFATHGYQHVWSYTVVNLWSALLVLEVLRGGRVAARFSHPLLVYTGTISYGLYVFHYPILGLLKTAVFFRPYSVRGVAAFAIYILAVFATASLSFWCFEKRILARKDALFARRAPAPTIPG